MSLTSIRLPDHLIREVDHVATDRRLTRSDVIRAALEQYCANARNGGTIDRLALLHRLVTYAGSGRGDLGRHSEKYLREIFHARRRNRTR